MSYEIYDYITILYNHKKYQPISTSSIYDDDDVMYDNNMAAIW